MAVFKPKNYSKAPDSVVIVRHGRQPVTPSRGGQLNSYGQAVVSARAVLTGQGRQPVYVKK